MDMLSKPLADFNVGATREFTLKPEQELVVTALNDGKDILAVLPTGYGKSLIYQIQDIKSIGYSTIDIMIRELTVSEIRQCNFKVAFAIMLRRHYQTQSKYLCCCSGRFVCVLRITRITPEKVLRNQGLPRTSLLNSDLFAVVEQYFCLASFRCDSRRKRSFG